MAETLTAHYAWTKPDPGASANTWGTTLNATTDKIDAQVYVNQQAGVPIGTIMMWAGATAPTNWLLCDGSSLSTTGTYAALFAVCGYAFGGSGANFNLPNLSQRFPMGAGGGTLGATGGAASVTLDATMIPSHAHTATQAAHNHSVSIAESPHGHGVNQWFHDHGFSQTPHGHNDSGHSHSYIHADVGHAGFSAGGAFGGVFGDQTGISSANITASNALINFVGQTTNISIQTNSTGITATTANATPAITVANTGGGGAHENRPPFVQINYIIRYQ